jgi:hypothetical protein
MKTQAIILNSLGWIAGLLFSAIGLINLRWGNDPVFGLFILGLSLLFYPPLEAWLKKRFGYRLHPVLLILLALLLLWASLGVGELFAKIRLMMASFG